MILRKYIEMIDIGVPDVSMEVVGTVDEMYDDGVRLAEKFGTAATIKLPCTPDGLLVCKRLTGMGIKTNVTLVFCCTSSDGNEGRCNLSAPFVGRCNDNSFSGVELVRAIATCRSVHGMKTEVLLHLCVMHIMSLAASCMVLTLLPCQPKCSMQCMTVC